MEMPIYLYEERTTENPTPHKRMLASGPEKDWHVVGSTKAGVVEGHVFLVVVLPEPEKRHLDEAAELLRKHCSHFDRLGPEERAWFVRDVAWEGIAQSAPPDSFMVRRDP